VLIWVRCAFCGVKNGMQVHAVYGVAAIAEFWREVAGACSTSPLGLVGLRSNRATSGVYLTLYEPTIAGSSAKSLATRRSLGSWVSIRIQRGGPEGRRSRRIFFVGIVWVARASPADGTGRQGVGVLGRITAPLWLALLIAGVVPFRGRFDSAEVQG